MHINFTSLTLQIAIDWLIILFCCFKRKAGDLVYAQLGEFDGENDDTKPQKPPSHEPTVYADVDVVPPEVFNRTDPESTQPTYANVQTTGV